jgi:UDP-N-acetylmuramate: L-alanyl-gamma-D-glutamyl-meso-diaminopimelate ligase
VRNALAALAVGVAVGLSTDTMAAGFRAFKGVRRRMQHRGTVRGVAVYDDFAHHPTAIGETLAGVRSAYPERRIWAIFEPRSATSCRRIFQADFARALARADRVIVPAVFRSTLPDDERLSAEQLVLDLDKAGVNARYIPEVDAIVRTVGKDARDGDLVIIMSNGGFDNIHEKILKALEAR